MGADLLLAVIARPKDKKLKWTAGRAVIRKMDPEKLLAAIEEIDGDHEGVTLARQRANQVLTDLKKELKLTDARDAYEWEVGRYHLSIRGGTSWGDEPSGGFTAITDAHYFPDALKAIGFSCGVVKNGFPS
jgi:hypothetical protein